MKNTEFLDHKVNVTFETVRRMSDQQFIDWCIELRKVVVDLWDNKGLPPRVGYSDKEIIEQFNEMIGFPVHEFLLKDETGDFNIIKNTSRVGSACTDFFPTMMKTRINYSEEDKGRSIYDFFALDELKERFITYSKRHFKRDSFYHYSQPIIVGDINNIDKYPSSKNGLEWVIEFEKTYRKRGIGSYWFAPIKKDKIYTGYNEELKERKNILITQENLKELFNKSVWNNDEVLLKEIGYDYQKSDIFEIRYFDYKQKLFPLGLKAFRVSYCQYAVNFPPLTAKLLYELNSSHLPYNEEPIIIYDPSCGWGGRILGAMAASSRSGRTFHYVGTDPNTDHLLPNGKTKYELIAEIFNTKTLKSNALFPSYNTYEIFTSGSENIHEILEFQKYKGKVDIVFTSPPYFNREAYSEDETQSYKKFTTYESWVDGFLKPTLKTCVEWLKPNGRLLWNIADLKIGKEKYLPLEKSSEDILRQLNMKYITTYKMALMNMPGANRIDEEGKILAKNSIKLNGKATKYEPIFVWEKSE